MPDDSSPPDHHVSIRITPDEYLELDSVISERVLTPSLPFWRVVRRSLDARGRSARFEVQVELSATPFVPESAEPTIDLPAAGAPVALVVGAGPAGLFAALGLLERGVKPVVLERGEAFPARHLLVRDLRYKGSFSAPPAMTSGLGGAGAYSDGKLFTRKRSPQTARVRRLMAWLAEDANLMMDAHPHVGSNRLPRVVTRLVEFLAARGAEFRFGTEVSGLVERGGTVAGVRLVSGETLAGDATVLAVGNHARTLVAQLHEDGVALEAKGLAVGVRVEHPASLIDRIQLGALAGHPACGSARYAFAFEAGERGVYSFCMCPGGYVIPAPPEEGCLSVNGMSFATRSSRWSNAAVVASVSPADWDASSPLGGIQFLRDLEKAAFAAGGGGYRAPAQRRVDFLAGHASTSLPECSYKPGVMAADVGGLFSGAVLDGLREGLTAADKKLRGYLHPDAVVIAAETLTSSPIRFPRTSEGTSISHDGLFPCGEGGGWAGGITSSAADGLVTGARVADRLGL